jgi:hypothetical protein
MRQNLLILCLFFFVTSLFSSKDSSAFRNRGISIGTKKFGICFGNREKYSGLKFSLSNRSKRVNGISASITCSDQNPTVNGIDIGVINFLGKMNGIQLGLIGVSIDEESHGLYINPMVTDTWKASGVAITGIIFFNDKFNGFSFSGVSNSSNYFNGVLISPGSNLIDSVMNGFSFGGIRTSANRLNGVTIGAVNRINQGKGVQLGLFNSSDDFKGVQIGLINIIRSNRKFFRVIPFINFRFKKTKDESPK